MSTSSKWEYFSKEELECPDGCGHGEDMMDDTFMTTMVVIRRACGFPFPVTSAYRCPAYNARISTTGEAGPHTTGRAMDIALSRHQADIADRIAVKMVAITGRGWKQHGNSRFLHFDDLPEAEGRPRPAIWTYK